MTVRKNTIVPGDDAQSGFKLTADGEPLLLSELHEVFVWVYHVVNHRKKLICTRQKTLTGLEGIAVDPVDSERNTFIVDRSLTKDLSGTDVYAEFKIQRTADSPFPGGLKNDGQTGKHLYYVEISVNPDGAV
jgi:hypothetical protein